jgi:hypothetical protein
MKNALDRAIENAEKRGKVARITFAQEINKLSPCIVSREDIGDDDCRKWVYFLTQSNKEICFSSVNGKQELIDYARENGISLHWTF